MTHRIVKRIAPDFSWVLGETWHGYINPWPSPVPCVACMTSGLNPPTKKLFDQFRSWSPRMTREEARLLEEKGITPKEIQRIRNRIFKGEGPVLRPTLVEIRAKRKNVFGLCSYCAGEGFVANPNPAVVTLYAGVNLFEEWQPTEPPSGIGWQLWDDETGAPISDIFETSEGLAVWCFETFKSDDLVTWIRWVESAAEKPKERPRPPFRIPSDHFKLYSAPKSKYTA